MAKEKASDAVINFLTFRSLNLKNMTNPPAKVDNPAMVDTSKAPIISILSPLNYMNYQVLTCHNNSGREKVMKSQNSRNSRNNESSRNSKSSRNECSRNERSCRNESSRNSRNESSRSNRESR